MIDKNKLMIGSTVHFIHHTNANGDQIVLRGKIKEKLANNCLQTTLWSNQGTETNKNKRKMGMSSLSKESVSDITMISRNLTPREQELLDTIQSPSFDEVVEEVRASLPPTRYTRSRYMRNCQGLL